MGCFVFRFWCLASPVSATSSFQSPNTKHQILEAISKKGFWFKIAADTRFEPTAQQSLRKQEYSSISTS